MSLVVLLAVLASFVALSVTQRHYGSGYFENFECGDGATIEDFDHCDGIEDCADGSDEQDCPIRCDLQQFRCHDNSRCISKWKLCNSNLDCSDGSDELDCAHTSLPVANCSEHQVLCANNQSCVWISFLCDDESDCEDISDELDCELFHHGEVCSENQYQCNSGSCIPRLYLCDGEIDCHDDAVAADEAICGNRGVSCSPGFFSCSNGRCVSIHRRCDGVDNCGNNLDEEDCPSRCPGNEFRCPRDDMSVCVKNASLCDGVSDCDNSEDEYHCGNLCPASSFQCSSSPTCIALEHKCDGVTDCPDSSDEFVCSLPPPPVPCAEDMMRCLDGQLCLEATDVCDGHYDCQDESDEVELCMNNFTSCDDDNGGCEHDCHTLQGNRTACSCRYGFSLNTSDYQSCEDVDECSWQDSCPQFCTNTLGSFTCFCASGYVETFSGGCKAIGPKANIVFANRVDIRSVGLDGNGRHLLVKHLTYASDVDYHYRRGLLYWTDKRAGVIMSAALSDGFNVTMVISSGLKAPSSLAVDWIGDNLYWVDIGAGVIEVADLDGRYRKPLFSINVDKPKAVVLDPLSRLMFWTDMGTVPKIERASMDGAGRTILHNKHLVSPTTLTIDLPTRTIFWADKGLHIIESSDYYGQNRRPILTTEIRHPFGLAVFENRLYWSDWTRSVIMSASTYRARNLSLLEDASMNFDDQILTNTTVVHQELFYPMGLQVVHPILQPSYVSEDPCSRAARQGLGCQFLCLLSSEDVYGYSCACPTWKQPNGRVCESVKSFLVYSRRKLVHMVTLDGPEPIDITMPLYNVRGPVGVDFNPDTEIFYWTDVSKDQINSLNLHTFQQETVISSGLVTATGVAVDWLNRKLYWTNTGTGRSTIEVAELEDRKQRTVLLAGGVVYPTDIVVHPTAGFFFWTDANRDRPLVGRANLDGSEKIIIADTGLVQPTGLALDFEYDRIYWCESRAQLIEYSDFDGSNRTVLISGGINPMALTLYGNQIFWSDWINGSIEVADKLTGQDIRSFIRVKDVIFLNAFSEQHWDTFGGITPEFNPCFFNNGGCRYMCLTRPSHYDLGLEVSCTCPEGRTLMADGRNCHTDIQQYLIVPTNQKLLLISLDTMVHDQKPLDIHGFKIASAVAVDILHDEVYWTNIAEGVIYRSRVSGGGRTRVISVNLVTPEAIAIDWVGRNLYWADSRTGCIEVLNLDSNNRKVVVHGGVGRVISLELDLQTRTMYWVDTSNWKPKIEMAAMDGSGRITIVSDHLQQPRDIAVYHPPGALEGVIFWTDERRGIIESATLNGSNRTTVVVLRNSTGGAPYSIAVNDDSIYWTTITGAIYRIARVGKPRVTVVAYTGYATGQMILARKDYSNVDKAVFNYPCNSMRNCSYLCLPNWSSEGYSCQCRTGVSKDTETTCKKLPQKFLYTSSSQNKMYQIFRSAHEAGDSVVVQGGPWRPMMFDHILYSSESGRVFFSNSMNDTIMSMNLDGTDKVDLLNVNYVQGLAVDWVGKKLYWVDTLAGTLEVAHLNGTGRKVLYQHSISSINRTWIRSLALYPKTGVMLWTMWGHRPSITRSRMDGSFVSPIIETNIVSPSGIAIDIETATVYWADTDYHHIECSDMNGGNRRIVINNLFLVYHGFHLLIRNKFLYWSDWADVRLYEAPLPKPSSVPERPDNVSVILSLTGEVDNRIFGFTVIDLASPRPGELIGSQVYGACAFNNGGCSPVHICLPIGSNYRKCACPDKASICTEYEGIDGQPPPRLSPPSFDTPRLTTPTSNKPATIITTEKTTQLSSTDTVKPNVYTAPAYRQTSQSQNSSISETRIIVITLITMVVTVSVFIVVLVVTACIYLKRSSAINAANQKLLRHNLSYAPMRNLRSMSRESSLAPSIPLSVHSTPARGDQSFLLPAARNPIALHGTSNRNVPNIEETAFSPPTWYQMSPANGSPLMSSTTVSDDIDMPLDSTASVSHRNDNDTPIEPQPPPVPPRTYKS